MGILKSYRTFIQLMNLPWQATDIKNPKHDTFRLLICMNYKSTKCAIDFELTYLRTGMHSVAFLSGLVAREIALSWSSSSRCWSSTQTPLEACCGSLATSPCTRD